MDIEIGTVVMLPGYAPYPRYGRLLKRLEDGRWLVGQVQCGDPRCAAEHCHADAAWSPEGLQAAAVYQPRAPWEHGRKSSPNTPLG